MRASSPAAMLRNVVKAAWLVTFWVQASDCWRSVSMVAAAALLVGRTENLFSSCISSLRASLSALSFSMAALHDYHNLRGTLFTAEFTDREHGGCLRPGLPLLSKELLRLCEYTVLRAIHCQPNNICARPFPAASAVLIFTSSTSAYVATL